MKNRMRLEMAALSENERFARTVCAAFVLGLDPTLDEIDEIKTAVSEAVTNSVIHAYEDGDGTIVIEGETDGRCVSYIISDSGCGIADVDKAREPLYTGKPDSERSGMGFSIMEAFMDELEVESSPGKGTRVTMRKRISEDDREP